MSRIKRTDDEQWIPNSRLMRGGPQHPFPVYQLITITSEIGSGKYNWKRFDITVSPFQKAGLWGEPGGGSSPNGTCYELSLKTGVTGSFLAFRYRGIWFFQAGGSGGIGGGASFYGDASDGSVVLDGTTGAFVPDYFNSNDVSGAKGYGYLLTQCYAPDGTPAPGIGNAGTQVFNPGTFTNGGKYYWLWRPAFFDHLTINSGVTLFTNGFPIFGNKLSGPGTIDCSGNMENIVNNPAGIVQSNPNPANTDVILAFCGAVLGNAIGFGPGAGGGLTTNGGTAPQQTSIFHCINSLDAGAGFSNFAKGGKGGNAGAHTGGLDAYAIGNNGSNWNTVARVLGAVSHTFGTGTGLQPAAALALGGSGGGGQPGSGGAGDTAVGGNGGFCGGWVAINAIDMSGFTGVISANGEAGYPGHMGGNSGGGGGGSGGVLQVSTDVTKTTSKTWTTTVIGGTGGIGQGTGTNGAVGSSGISTGTYP